MNAAPARGLSASAAVVVLAGLPLLIAPANEEGPPPSKGALTVELEGDEGAAVPYLIKSTGPDPAPTKEATLRDDSGRYRALAAPRGSCQGGSERVAFPGEMTTWCVRLSDVPAGHELTGSVTNTAGDELALTVKRRDGFGGGPLLVLVAGLLAGLLVVLVPRWLRALVRWIVLQKLISENQSGAEGDRIDGLSDWVTEQHGQGVDRETLIAAVHRVTSSGPARAEAARGRLTDAIKEAPDIRDHKLVEEAGKVRDDRANRMTDFYEEGEELKEHRADTWAAAVTRLAEVRAELAGQEAAIEQIDPEFAGPAQAALETAKERYAQLVKPGDLVTMTPRLDALRLAVDEGLARSRTAVADALRADGLAAAASPPVAQAGRGALETAIPLGLSAGTLKGWAAIAIVATALVALIALGYAFVTVKQAGYDAKPLFHDDADYLALFAAALGSGAAATVLALVANWRPAADDEDI